MTNNCPECGSDQTQAIRMVLATGTHEGGGMTLGYAPRGGFGIAGTGMNLQSTLAAKYDPGMKPARFGTVLFPFLGGILGFIGVGMLIALLANPPQGPKEIQTIIVLIAIVVFILPAILCFKALIGGNARHESNVARWEEKRRIADHAWVCLRCGKDWMPGETTPPVIPRTQETANETWNSPLPSPPDFGS